MTREHDVPELRESQPNASGPDAAAGGMGVSSERTGPTGPGQHGTDGLRDTSIRASREPDSPAQADEEREENPEGIAPKAGYPSLDPRS